MSRLNEAKQLLADLGVPDQYNSDLMRYAFLALLDIRDNSSWDEATNEKLMRLHDIFGYIQDTFDKTYAENSRETLLYNTPKKIVCQENHA